jgi:hypothetical protein
MEKTLKAAYATPRPLVEKAMALMRGDEPVKVAPPK